MVNMGITAPWNYTLTILLSPYRCDIPYKNIKERDGDVILYNAIAIERSPYEEKERTMGSENIKDARKRYSLRPTYTPLPSSSHASSNESNSVEEGIRSLQHDSALRPLQSAQEQPIRADNEDDDLYDPYSDYHDGTLRPLEFEADPWD